MKPSRIVYVAGPISSDPLIGTRNAILAAAQLRSVGLGFVVPHLSVLMQIVTPHDYESWMGLDLALLERCDALLRIPGESSGADREVQHAYAQGIPVYRDIGQCINEMAPTRYVNVTMDHPLAVAALHAGQDRSGIDGT